MAFFKTLLIASVAAVAYAAPQGAADGKTEVNVKSDDASAKCGNGQKLACCNSGEDLIGLNCLNIPIRELTISHTTESATLTVQQLLSPSSRPAAPTSLRAARLATPPATSSTLRPTAFPSRFKRDKESFSTTTTFSAFAEQDNGFRVLGLLALLNGFTG